MTADEHDLQRVGPYTLVRELGRGGQAIVWLADDSRIGRQVALKVLPNLGPGAESALRRFKREAEVAARLEHPSICAVLEADLDRGTPYIAMRLVPGETLARRIALARDAAEPPPDAGRLREIAHLFEKIARALHAAHEAGVLHRDVKPANLMITPDGEPVILDFGLARDDDPDSASLSLTGEVSGTPAYMSPEQMTGRTKPDRRADVWSLGVALHEAATQTHPFSAATREELYQAILTEDPADPRRTNPSIDRDLATILAAATAKEPDRRYQTALALAEDLHRWRENMPILARPVGRLERVRRWTQRKPALAASLGAAALLLVAASAFLAYGVGAAGRAESEAALRQVAEEARGEAETQRARADLARQVLEQATLDRALAAELDELDMLMGTLWFGVDEKDAVPALASRYLAAFRRFGVDLERDEEVPAAIAKLAALHERSAQLGRTAVESLSSLAWCAESETAAAAPGTLARARAVLAALPAEPWPELDLAVQRWSEAQQDEFAPLLAPEVLASRSSEQLRRLAAELFAVPARHAASQEILERALALDPGSFRLHFLAAALGFMQFGSAIAERRDTKAAAERLVHHLDVAVALRPRSGFVRVIQASGFAMAARYQESMRALDTAVELEPANPFVWLIRARYFTYTPFHERGIEACRKALELDPGLASARELLAEFEARAKK